MSNKVGFPITACTSEDLQHASDAWSDFQTRTRSAHLVFGDDTPANALIDAQPRFEVFMEGWLMGALSHTRPHTEHAAKPIPMRLTCPDCGELHLDEGEFAVKPHHTHSCQACGMTWRPAVVHTVGVRFLPGFKNP